MGLLVAMVTVRCQGCHISSPPLNWVVLVAMVTRQAFNLAFFSRAYYLKFLGIKDLSRDIENYALRGYTLQKPNQLYFEYNKWFILNPVFVIALQFN